MSLADIERALRAQLSTGGDLAFSAVAAQGVPLGAVLDALPPISTFPITGADLQLSAEGADQTLTIGGSVAWGLLAPTTVAITVKVDPTDATRYVVSIHLAAPATATLEIPGVDWFSLGHFAIDAGVEPAAKRQIELLPGTVLSVSTTLVIQGDSNKTTIPITITDDPAGSVMVNLDTADVVLPSINDVLAAFGSAGSAVQLPKSINDLVSFSLEDLFVRFDPSTGTVQQIGVQIGKHASQQTGWPIVPDVFTLDSYALGLNIIDPLQTKLVGGMVSATGKLGSVDLGVAAVHPASGGWLFSGYIGKEHGVPLGEIVSGLGKQFDVTMPAALSSFELNDFEFSFDSLTYDAKGHFSLDFDVNGTAVDLTVSAARTKNASTGPGPPTYKVDVDGELVVGSSKFVVKVLDTSFAATWSDEAEPLQFADIAKRFGFKDVPPIPPALDLDLVSAAVRYDFKSQTDPLKTSALAVTAKSKTYGEAAFAAVDGQYFFGVRMDHPIVLTDIPLFKSIASPGTTVKIDELQLVVGTKIDAPTALRINAPGFLDPSAPHVQAGGMTAGAALTMKFTAGTYAQAIAISTAPANPGGGGGTLPPGTGVAAPGTNGTVASSTAPDGTVWYELQKSFGPVCFQKIGIRYLSPPGGDAAVSVLVNASIEATVLTLSILGLGVRSPLTKFEPEFTIDGIAVTVAAGPLEASGGLMGTIDPLNLDGELVLKFGEFSISALGGYAESEGHPSFFLYAALDAPLGGPPFLFVTGVAAGLGFNRALVIPDVSRVKTFPLVAWAEGNGAPPLDPGGDIGAQVTAALSALANTGVVAPKLGSYWLALGLRFKSFEVIDVFALLTVTFGTRFEIDLLGFATLSMPPDDDTPVARVELELEASFSPDTGLIAVAGQLTNESYVFAQAAHLTGGFAVYTWVAGEHEGDFVLTIGGYNPNFTVPAHYPAVPRVGLNWQVFPGTLSIQGGLYFALTSNAVMAGGKLSAVWASGAIKAWFTVWADFLIVFQPFHYAIDAGIDLGVSLSFKILFIYVDLTIHLGVGLKLWGPQFAGVATVDLGIISFDIHFADSAGPSQDTTLKWDEFVAQLLPSTPAGQVAAGTAAVGDETQPAVVQISVTQGLLKTLDTTPANPRYLVDGEAFQCQVSTAMPFKKTAWSGIAKLAPDAQQPHDGTGNLIEPNTTFSAGVAGISAADFNPALAIDVAGVDGPTLHGVRVLRNAPKAFWETKSFTNGVPHVDPATGLTETTIPNAPAGYVLIPEVAAPDKTLDVSLDILELSIAGHVPFSWSSPQYATTDPFTTETVAGSITDGHVAKVREVTLAAMAGQSFTVDASVTVQSLADPANNDLMAAPVLSLLGEQRARATATDGLS